MPDELGGQGRGPEGWWGVGEAGAVVGRMVKYTDGGGARGRPPREQKNEATVGPPGGMHGSARVAGLVGLKQKARWSRRRACGALWWWHRA